MQEMTMRTMRKGSTRSSSALYIFQLGPNETCDDVTNSLEVHLLEGVDTVELLSQGIIRIVKIDKLVLK